jgi:hypothetical protein
VYGEGLDVLVQCAERNQRSKCSVQRRPGRHSAVCRKGLEVKEQCAETGWTSNSEVCRKGPEVKVQCVERSERHAVKCAEKD